MATPKNGLAPLPTGLLRPTTPPPAAEPADDAPEGAEPEQGRGEAAPEPKAPKSRRKRPTPAGESKGRKIHLPDSVHDRLWLLARQRKTTVSAVASQILDQHLPRFRVEREG